MWPSSELNLLKQSLNGLDLFKNYEVDYLSETASTNDVLKADWAYSKPIKRVLIADSQTCGRGRFNNKWLCRPNQALIFSFSLFNYKKSFPLTLVLGAAMYEAIKFFSPDAKDLWLKWPNDLWLKNGKLAGMLCESCFCGENQKIIAGIGLNLLPLNNAFIASNSLSSLCPGLKSLNLLKQFFFNVSEFFNMPSAKLLALYKADADRFFKIPFRFTLPNQANFEGFASDITQNGCLIALNKADNQAATLNSASLKPLF